VVLINGESNDEERTGRRWCRLCLGGVLEGLALGVYF